MVRRLISRVGFALSVWLLAGGIGSSCAWGSCGDYVIFMGADSRLNAHSAAELLLREALPPMPAGQPVCRGGSCQTENATAPRAVPTSERPSAIAISPAEFFANATAVKRRSGERASESCAGFRQKIKRPPRV